jgi:Antibiotic biosynthesis monooxygenase
MAHVTTFEFRARPGKRSKVIDQFEKWDGEQESRATGFQQSLLVASLSDPDAFVAVGQFDTSDNYKRNSDRAETNGWYETLRANLVADPRWFDGTVATESRS